MTPREKAVSDIAHMVDTYPSITVAMAVTAVLSDLIGKHKRDEIDEPAYLNAVVGIGALVAERWGQ